MRLRSHLQLAGFALLSSSPGTQPGAPAGRDGLPGCQPAHTLPGLESVRWAGHRLSAQASTATMRGQRVTGEQLNDRITAIHPQLGALSVRSVQPHPRPAGAVAGEVGEGVVDAL